MENTALQWRIARRGPCPLIEAAPIMFELMGKPKVLVTGYWAQEFSGEFSRWAAHVASLYEDDVCFNSFFRGNYGHARILGQFEPNENSKTKMYTILEAFDQYAFAMLLVGCFDTWPDYYVALFSGDYTFEGLSEFSRENWSKLESAPEEVLQVIGFKGLLSLWSFLPDWDDDNSCLLFSSQRTCLESVYSAAKGKGHDVEYVR